MIKSDPERLVDAERGIVSREIFSSEEIYALEQQRIFRQMWCFLGHESSIPNAGDFITTTIGEDPVVVWRDDEQRVRAYLNTCPHRGNKLCLFDEGSAKQLTCIYHGWSFNPRGELVGVPFVDRAYYGELNRDENGLLTVPRVETFGGLVFGCWDPDAPSLEAHLGELRWWLEAFLASDDLGGMAVLPGTQRYRTSGNWKIFCDNFAGDRYHTLTTHASALKLGLARRSTEQGSHGYFMAFLEPAHGVGGFFTDTAQFESDLGRAETLGSDVVDYVRERFALMQKRMEPLRDKPTHFSFGLGFPNFLIQGVGRAFQGNLVGTCHPRGMHESEVQQWVLVERDAPDVVKREAARFVSRGQSGAGLIGVDDGENFDRITENTTAPSNGRLTFHYGMGVEQEGRWPGQDEWRVDGVPGLVGPEFWEVSQRRFYKRWAELMAD